VREHIHGGTHDENDYPPTEISKAAAAIYVPQRYAAERCCKHAGSGADGRFVAQSAGTGGTTAATTGITGIPATTLTLPPTAAPTTVAAATGSTAAATTAAPVTTVAAPAGVADGTYVGEGSRNRWGTVQVQVVYAGGQINDVQILQYPNGDNRSIRINQYALPILINESIQAQSANINGIGGATYTSNSYFQSLQSAIDTAKAQSGVAG